MQEDGGGITCASVETVLRWKRRSQSLSVQKWGTAKSPLCYFILYHFFWEWGAWIEDSFQGIPACHGWVVSGLGVSWYYARWGLHVRWLTGNSTSATLHLAEKWVPQASSGPEREDTFASAPVLWAVWFLSLLGSWVLTGRHQAQKNKCYFFCLHVVSFWFLGYVVEEFEGLADLG